MNKTETPPDSINLPFLEDLYADYARDSNLVSPEWRSYFKQFLNGDVSTPQPRLGPSFRPASLFNPAPASRFNGAATQAEAKVANLQDRVNQLIRIYRVRGHIIA